MDKQVQIADGIVKDGERVFVLFREKIAEGTIVVVSDIGCRLTNLSNKYLSTSSIHMPNDRLLQRVFKNKDKALMFQRLMK